VTATDVASKADLEALEEDEDEEEPQSNSIVDKIKKQLPFLSKLIPAKKNAKSVRDDDKTDPGVGIQSEDDEDEDKPKKSAKKKPNKIILIVVGLGLSMLFLEDFLPKEEPAAEPVVQTPKKKSQRELDKEKAAAEKAAGEQTPAPETDTAQTPVETPVETPSEVPVEPPTEVVPEDVVAQEPTEAPVAPTEEAPTVEETPSETITNIPTEEPASDITGTLTEETPVMEEPPGVVLAPETDEDSSLIPGDNASEDQIGMPGDTTIGGGDLTDKILQDLEKQAVDKEKSTPKKREYVSPPDYEYAGRGLVYNCAGKHWACVDAPSYKTCEQNYDGNKALNKKIECYPFNVYDKTKSCTTSQLQMASSNAKTAFCNE
jgi:hypothetical protein